jgi:hypothetical protein
LTGRVENGEWRRGESRDDVGERPDGAVLELIDHNSIYKAGNVRWVESGSRKIVRKDALTINGVTGTLEELNSRFGVASINTVYRRINAGMSKEEAILTPIGEREHPIKHGYARRGQKFIKEYRTWRAMCRRCKDPNVAHYERYGGRGIKVCDRWLDFENFLADMGPCPGENFTIERKNNDGDYEKENCCWIPAAQQAQNTSQNKILTVRDVTACLAELCRHFNVPYSTAQRRLKRGLTAEETFPKKDGEG